MKPLTDKQKESLAQVLTEIPHDEVRMRNGDFGLNILSGEWHFIIATNGRIILLSHPDRIR